MLICSETMLVKLLGLFGACGLCLSAYAVYIENMRHSDSEYKAYCDFDDTVACSTVLTSEYSIGMGVINDIFGENHPLNLPNSYYGVLVYSFQLILLFLPGTGVIAFLVLLNTVVCSASVYLLYVLFFVMQKICLVCIGVHLVNFSLLVCSILRLVRQRGCMAVVHSKKN